MFSFFSFFFFRFSLRLSLGFFFSLALGFSLPLGILFLLGLILKSIIFYFKYKNKPLKKTGITSQGIGFARSLFTFPQFCVKMN